MFRQSITFRGPDPLLVLAHATSIFLAFVSTLGCQTTSIFPAWQTTTTPIATTDQPAPPRRLPAVQVGTSNAQRANIQLAAFDEPLPKPQPDPETVPSTALRLHASEGLTLSDLERMALSANPSLSRSAALVEAARGKWVQVGLPFNPSVGYDGQQLGSNGLAEQEGVFVSQEFVSGGKLQLNRNMAAQEIAKAESQLAAQQQRVLTDVRMAFNQVLIAQRQAKLTVELQQIAAAGVQTSEALLKGKEVGRVDLVQAQLEFENADILVQNAHNRSRAAWQTLATVVGDPGLILRPLDGDIEADNPPRDLNSTLENLLTASPEIAAARAEIERARWAYQRASVEKTPNVTVQGLVNWRDNGIGGGPDGSVSVGLPIPIWNRNQGAMVEASQQAAAAERALDQLKLSLQNRLAPVYERYANAMNQVEKYRGKILPAAQESLDLMRRSYQAGETGYVNLLTAQRTYSQTSLNYLESLRELRTAEAELDGLLLSGSLENR